MRTRGRRFWTLFFVNLLHPDSAIESNPKTSLEKTFSDILRNNKRGHIFRFKKGKKKLMVKTNFSHRNKTYGI